MLPSFFLKPLVDAVGHLEYLVHEEGEKIAHEEVHGEVLLAVAVVVVDVVSLILHRVEDLVFPHPPRPSDADQFLPCSRRPRESR